MTSEPRIPTAGRSRIAAAILLALLLVSHVYAVLVRADREPHMDETEYLHASWMMANGERLYETFFEHHSPFFFQIFVPLAPGENADVKPYVTHARWLAGAFGLVSLLALGTILWRVAPMAAPIGIGLMLATGPMWLRGFADIRPEVFALAFFLAGTAIALRTRKAAGGVGIGLVAISCLWNPKWPVACVAVGLIWLSLCDRRLRGIAAAAATTAAGFLVLRLIVPFDTWWFFNFEVNRVLARAVGESQWVLDSFFKGGVPFLYVPDAFGPWLVVPAALLLIGAFAVSRNPSHLLPVALLAAAFVELRFLYPWPGIWAHYYLMWAIAGAAVIASLPSAMTVLMQRAAVRTPLIRTVTLLVNSMLVLLVLAHVVAVAPTRGDAAPYWVSQEWMRERLRPGERVWVEPTRHPISVKDAHYYWFSVGQMAGGADQLRQTERGRRFLPPPAPYPTCTQPPNLRFTLHPRRASLTEAAECLDRLIAAGRARKTTIFDVYEIRLLESEATRSQ
jgi:hypothetical protein